MNFNQFKNLNIPNTSPNGEKENITTNSRTTTNESDIYFYISNNNSHLTYDNEVIIKLTNENEIQNNEILLLKSKIKKINYDYNMLKEKYNKVLIQLTNEIKQLESSNKKIKKEKEKYINNIKLLQINTLIEESSTEHFILQSKI